MQCLISSPELTARLFRLVLKLLLLGILWLLCLIMSSRKVRRVLRFPLMIIVLTVSVHLMMNPVLLRLVRLGRSPLRIPKNLLRILRIDRTFYFCAGDVEIYLASVSMNSLWCVVKGFMPVCSFEPIYKDYSLKESYFQFENSWKLYHFWRDMIFYYFKEYLR